MGLHQWLCLVAAWIAQRVFIEAAGLVDLIAPLPPRLNLKPVTARIAVPMPIYLF